MKNVIYIAALIIAAAAFYIYNNPRADFKNDKPGGIQFHRGGWSEALQLAEKENKLIFLDIYATWCGPCKKLKARTFSSSEVGDYFNANFINVALDGEQGDGAILASQYNVTSYPTLLFIDASGKIVMQTSGYYSTGELLELGKSIGR